MTHLKVSCESHLHKKLSQEKLCKLLTRVLCDNACKLNNESCRLVAFRGCYCVVILTGQSQLTVCERKLSAIELVLLVKVDFRK